MKTFNDINRTGNPQNPESEKSFENINEKDELFTVWQQTGKTC